jgi:MtN3 and saliva related transmembrane protein
MSPHVVGYASSIVLLFTIGGQLLKQWRSGTSAGVSPYLFIGQFVASTGFVAYSVLVKNVVFEITNACLGAAALLGIAMVAYHRRRNKRGTRRKPSAGAAKASLTSSSPAPSGAGAPRAGAPVSAGSSGGGRRRLFTTRGRVLNPTRKYA